MKYILLCLSFFSIVSCYDDLGNYNYKEINEIKVVGGIEKEYSAYTMVSTLKINPKLSFTQDSLPVDRFEYTWYAGSTDFNKAKLIKLSNSLNLDYFIKLPKDSYILELRVKDKETNVEWSTQTNLSVTTLFTNGWLMLGEKDGYVALDMVSIPGGGDTIVTTDLLKNSELPPLKGPRKMISINRPDNPAWPQVNGCFMMTDDGTYELDRVTMASDVSKNIAYNIYDPNVSSKFAGSDMIQNSAYARILIGDNTLYVNGSLTSSGAFGNPANKYDKYGATFKVWPEIMWSINSWGSFSYNQMVYDMDAKRFVKFRNSSSFCTILPDNAGDPFTWETGNDMVAVFNSKYVSQGYKTSYAIMKSPDKHYYLYSFVPGTKDGPKKNNMFDITSLPGIDRAKMFVFSGKYPYMLYAVGSELHACEFLVSGVTHKKLDDFDKDEITLLHFDTYKESTQDVFYVGTYNTTTGGMVQKYQLKDDPNDIIIEKIGSKWEHLCKVTSMCWKWF